MDFDFNLTRLVSRSHMEMLLETWPIYDVVEAYKNGHCLIVDPDRKTVEIFRERSIDD